MHFGRNAITLRPKRTTASAERRTQERFSAPSGKHFQKDSTNKEKSIAGNIYAGVQNPLQGLACWEKSLYLRNQAPISEPQNHEHKTDSKEPHK